MCSAIKSAVCSLLHNKNIQLKKNKVLEIEGGRSRAPVPHSWRCQWTALLVINLQRTKKYAQKI